MLDAIHEEITRRKDFLDDEVSTIYFGGGTPSVLEAKELEKILEHIQASFDISSIAELTLEANPDDLQLEYLQSIRSVGINRLSIGVQSFDEAALRWMNRSHDAYQAHQALLDARKAGFGNISMDLIYGLPEQSASDWHHQIDQALDYELEHYSCYALTVEPKTALAHHVKSGKSKDTKSELQSEHFDILMDRMASAKIEHYEISNFARQGYRSQHNSSYWSGAKYLGIGPSAHSYDGRDRYWNLAHNAKYMDMIRAGDLPLEKEELSEVDRYNEWVMCGLRLLEGCSKKTLKSEFGSFHEHFIKEATPYIQENLMQESFEHFRLTQAGKHYADRIASDLFVVI